MLRRNNQHLLRIEVISSLSKPPGLEVTLKSDETTLKTRSVRTQEPFAVKVDDMSRCLGYPNFGFPRYFI